MDLQWIERLNLICSSSPSKICARACVRGITQPSPIGALWLVIAVSPFSLTILFEPGLVVDIL